MRNDGYFTVVEQQARESFHLFVNYVLLSDYRVLSDSAPRIATRVSQPSQKGRSLKSEVPAAGENELFLCV